MQKIRLSQAMSGHAAKSNLKNMDQSNGSHDRDSQEKALEITGAGAAHLQYL